MTEIFFNFELSGTCTRKWN